MTVLDVLLDGGRPRSGLPPHQDHRNSQDQHNNGGASWDDVSLLKNAAGRDVVDHVCDSLGRTAHNGLEVLLDTHRVREEVGRVDVAGKDHSQAVLNGERGIGHVRVRGQHDGAKSLRRVAAMDVTASEAKLGVARGSRRKVQQYNVLHRETRTAHIHRGNQLHEQRRAQLLRGRRQIRAEGSVKVNVKDDVDDLQVGRQGNRGGGLDLLVRCNHHLQVLRRRKLNVDNVVRVDVHVVWLGGVRHDKHHATKGVGHALRIDQADHKDGETGGEHKVDPDRDKEEGGLAAGADAAVRVAVVDKGHLAVSARALRHAGHADDGRSCCDCGGGGGSRSRRRGGSCGGRGS
eukprot:m.121967 g.121967  ORF g.121967 m.121967 type:complete len:347 (-) comp16212_c0_seq4:274-1314(-)